MKISKKILIGILASILLVAFGIYVFALWMLNKDTAYVLDYDIVNTEGMRMTKEGDIYFSAGEADIFCPSLGLTTECYPEDNILISLCITKKLFGEEERWIFASEIISGDVIGEWILEMDGSLSYEDESDTRNNALSEETWSKYSDEIQMLIEAADEKWDIIE